MSKLFCVSPGLRVLERQMQQPPGYRPRGYGICVMDVDWRSRGNYSEIVDCVISRMQMEHLKKRVDEIFCEVDKELIFRNPKHRNDFYLEKCERVRNGEKKLTEWTDKYISQVIWEFLNKK